MTFDPSRAMVVRRGAAAVDDATLECRPWWNQRVTENDGTGADFCVKANLDRAQDGDVGTDDDAVADARVTNAGGRHPRRRSRATPR